jgi:hypothetical protein
MDKRRSGGRRVLIVIVALASLCVFVPRARAQAWKGDLNSDGSTNVTDLQLLVNLILAGRVSVGSDVNGDGRVDVVDVQQLVNIILGTLTPAPPMPRIGGCQVFPADNPWNRDVSGDPVHANSASYIAFMNGGTRSLHPDFGSDPTYGIPYIVVPGTQTRVPVSFDYADESDPGPYPIPADAPIEGGASSTGDRHVLVVDRDTCRLYETWDSHYAGPGWNCGSGAVFDFGSNALRPDYWTSADAAGLPVLPGLVRYEEAVLQGEIRHAIRFTTHTTQRAFIHPATHFASSTTNASAPPMGLRVRLKAGYDISRFTGSARVILTAMKKYGMILADNGSDWYFTGATDSRWDDDDLNQLKSVPGSAFEAVESGPLIR